MSLEPLYDSAQCGSPEIRELREIWRYRALLVQLIRRDLVTRYKRSVIGVIWTMLHPLGMMLILTLVFAHLFGNKRGASAYLLSGLVAWNFFSYSTMTSMNNLLWGGTLLRRIYIPPTSFALSAVGTGLVNFFISLVPLIGVMLVVGQPITNSVFYLPIPMLLLAMFALGMAMLLCSVAVFFYDVAEMYVILLNAWFYLTPILYPEEMLRNKGRGWLLHYNPMYYFLKLFRKPIYDGLAPTWGDCYPAILLAIAALVVGWSVYTRKSREFAYRV